MGMATKRQFLGMPISHKSILARVIPPRSRGQEVATTEALENFAAAIAAAFFVGKRRKLSKFH